MWDLDDAEALTAARELIAQYAEVEPAREDTFAPSAALFTPA